jgi:hypothetical protein
MGDTDVIRRGVVWYLCRCIESCETLKDEFRSFREQRTNEVRRP